MKNNTAIQTTNHAISSITEMKPETVELIKNTVAKFATNLELDFFLHLAKSYNLDPFAKEIWCLKYLKQGQRPEDVPATIMTSRDGYLKIANLNEQMDGLMSDTVYEHDKFVKNTDNSVQHTYGNPRGKLIGAYALTYRKDRRFPVYAFAPLDEYKREFNPVWKSNPSAMILKVAEAMSLKRAFNISGLVTREEMDVDNESFSTYEDLTPKPAVAVEKMEEAKALPEPAALPVATGSTPAPDLKAEILSVLNNPVFTEKERTDIKKQLNSMPLEVKQENLDRLKATVYNRDLGHAIVEINKCTTLDCLKDTWSKYRLFQKEPSFIKAKDNKKTALSSAAEEATPEEIKKPVYGATKDAYVEILMNKGLFTNAELTKELLIINKITEEEAIEKLDYYSKLQDERKEQRFEEAHKLYEYVTDNYDELGEDEAKKFFNLCDNPKVPVTALRAALDEAKMIVSQLPAK